MLILFWLVPLFEGLDSPWLFALAWPAWTYWTFTKNFYMHEMGFGPQWLSVTWSLAIEEQFYLVIPWLVRWLRPRNLVVLFALGLVTAPAWREFLPSLGGYLLPFARADAICLGGLIAVAYRDEKLAEDIKSRQSTDWRSGFGECGNDLFDRKKRGNRRCLSPHDSGVVWRYHHSAGLDRRRSPDHRRTR